MTCVKFNLIKSPTMNQNKPEIPYVFFGTPSFAVDILNILKEKSYLPSLIVTSPDKPKGRGQKVSSPPVGDWAKKNNIPILQPKEIDSDFMQDLKKKSQEAGCQLFVVVAYGHILPTELIYLPEHNTLNLHPSLLPKLRGPAPIRTAILEEHKSGVSIIELDEKMDHGPVVSQEELQLDDWPPTYPELKDKLTQAGGDLLANTIPKWVSGEITAVPQKHGEATYSKKFDSDDGRINLDDDPELNLRKIRAFTDWPKAFLLSKDGTRVLVRKAHLKNGKLLIDQVKPAGNEEMSYEQFLKRTNK